MPLRAGVLLVLGFIDLAIVMVLWSTFTDPEPQIRSGLETKIILSSDSTGSHIELKIHKHKKGNNSTKLYDTNKTSIAAFDKTTSCLFQRRIIKICEKLSSTTDENKQMHENIYQIIYKHVINPNCRLSSLVQHCAVLRLAHGYDDKPVTKEELDFPLAFGIRLHKSAEQAEKLLRSIYRPHNVYCIHVDRKADHSVYETIKSISHCFHNVFLVEDRETIVYSSSGVIKADLKCMLACLKSGIKWKYYLNLSGQEFPLRTNLEIVMILKIFQGANDIEAYDYPKYQEVRFKKIYISNGNHLVKTNVDKPRFGYSMQMSKGSAYGMFSRRFVQFLLTDDVANKLLKWLDDTCSPEENIWATLNSLPWAPGGYYVETRHSSNTHASRALIWRWDKEKCYGRFVRSVCVFTIKDLPWLISQPHVIANKFDIDDDRVAIDCLESMLLKRIHHPLLQTIDKNYFKNLPQVKFHREIKDNMKSDWSLKKIKKQWLDGHPWSVF